MIKRIFFTLSVLLLSAVIASAADNKAIQFEETTYDFGTVKSDNGPVKHEYEFVNTGDVPLTILSASASCGCTRPKYTPEPVKPGKKGKITVNFLPAGQRGYISKDIKVRYKSAGSKTRNITLKITGNVIPE